MGAARVGGVWSLMVHQAVERANTPAVTQNSLMFFLYRYILSRLRISTPQSEQVCVNNKV